MDDNILSTAHEIINLYDNDYYHLSAYIDKIGKSYVILLLSMVMNDTNSMDVLNFLKVQLIYSDIINGMFD